MYVLGLVTESLVDLKSEFQDHRDTLDLLATCFVKEEMIIIIEMTYHFNQRLQRILEYRLLHVA